MPACASARRCLRSKAAGISTARIAQAAAAPRAGRARRWMPKPDAFLAPHAHFDAGRPAFLDGAALRCRAARDRFAGACSAILMRVSGQAYRPRFERLEHLYDAARPLRRRRCRAAGSARRLRNPRHFGAATLEVRRENPRRPSTAPNMHCAKKPRAATAIAAAKLPKKGRIIGRLSGS